MSLLLLCAIAVRLVERPGIRLGKWCASRVRMKLAQGPG